MNGVLEVNERKTVCLGVGKKVCEENDGEKGWRNEGNDGGK